MKAKQHLKKLAKELNSYVRYAKYRYTVYQTFGRQNTETKLPIRFVIFSHPRSGSTLLCSILTSHPDILCHSELFCHNKIGYAGGFQKIYGNSIEKEISREDLVSGRVGIDTVEGRNRFPENFLIKIWQNSFDNKVVGFKLFQNQNKNVADLLVRDKNIKKILMLRQNKIRCYVSQLIAKKTGKWSIDKNETINKNRNMQSAIDLKVTSKKVTVDVDKLNKWSQQYDRYFDYLRKCLVDTNQCFIEVTYEDLVGSNRESVKSRLLEFIGVSAQFSHLQGTIKKQNPEKLSDLISNFDELKEKLVGTELEPMLSD